MKKRPEPPGGQAGRRSFGRWTSIPADSRRRRPRTGRRSRLFLAVADPAPHPALLATHLAAAFSTAATGHTFSWSLAN